MNRATFINKLRHNLKFLDKETKEKEVLYYINKIDKSKKSDEEVILSFGTMEEIKKEVCKRNNLDYEIINRQNNFFKDFYHDLTTLGEVLRKSDGKKKGRIVVDLLILVFVTCFLKVPFIFIRDIGDRLIEFISQSNITFLAIWGLIIEIFYVVFALLYFIRTFRKWFKNIDKVN